MIAQNDELSSHRTRTNTRTVDLPASTGTTAVLDAPDVQQAPEA